MLVPTAELAIKHRMEEQNTALPETSATTASQAREAALCALIGRMVRRDESALAEFYDATAAHVYACARRITRDPATAEEVVADVYLQAWQQADRYVPARGRARAWILMMCRTRALDHLRRRDPALPHAEPNSLRPDLYREDEDPLALLTIMQRDARLHMALSGLHDDARQLLTLAFFRGLSHQEIADHTGMPLGSVKTILRRAMQELKLKLAIASISLEGTS